MLNFEDVSHYLTEDASRYLTEDAPEAVREFFSTAVKLEHEKKKLIKQSLLQDAAKKQPHFYIQLGGEYLSSTDTHPAGYFMYQHGSWELMNSPDQVTMYIPETAKPKAVLKILKRIRQMIKREPDLIADISRRRRNALLDSLSRADDLIEDDSMNDDTF